MWHESDILGVGPAIESVNETVNETELDSNGLLFSVSITDLERIKITLLQWLSDHSENPDYADLRRVTAPEPCFIAEDGVARIGAWMLRQQAGKPVLIRTVARNPGTTVVPEATLAVEHGEWRVLNVGATVVRGRSRLTGQPGPPGEANRRSL